MAKNELASEASRAGFLGRGGKERGPSPPQDPRSARFDGQFIFRLVITPTAERGLRLVYIKKKTVQAIYSWDRIMLQRTGYPLF